MPKLNFTKDDKVKTDKVKDDKQKDDKTESKGKDEKITESKGKEEKTESKVKDEKIIESKGKDEKTEGKVKDEKIESTAEDNNNNNSEPRNRITKHRKPVKHATVRNERPDKSLFHLNTLSPRSSTPTEKKKDEAVVHVAMPSPLKPIFDTLRPIIEKHIEMKPILFEKVSKFDENPNLGDLLSFFTALIESYEKFASLFEYRRGIIKEAFTSKKKKNNQN